jgi:hypothetical protein
MRIYYRGPDALITDEHFIWKTKTPRAIAVRELRNIGLARGETTRGLSATTIAIGTATIALAVAGWLMLGTGLSYGLIAGALAGTTVTVTTWQKRNVRSWELRATLRGTPITLFSSLDERTFNQVTRALRRAVEEEHRARSDRRLAAAR